MRCKDSNTITRDYFESILLEMRHIDNAKPETGVKIFGEEFATPIATAALSHLNNTAPDGMKKMAEGALLAGALCFSGMAEKDEVDDMCGTGAKVIKIVKPHADNNEVIRKLKEAESCGAFAVGMDVDHSFNGSGEYDCVVGLDMHPKSLSEMKEFVKATSLPFVLKGVLSVQDAKKAVEMGASAIIVSHHHGIMDYAVPPLLILPEIKKAVCNKLMVFVDCCIESGADVFKALALGADAVCVGRAIMDPLKEKGAEGVKDTLLRMNAELKGIMARTGFARTEDINDSIIHYRQFPVI